jgi:hypothetical protein
VVFRSVLQLLFAGYVPSSPILYTLMMEVIRSSETSVLTRGTPRDNFEDGILFNHLRENLILSNNNNNKLSPNSTVVQDLSPSLPASKSATSKSYRSM